MRELSVRLAFASDDVRPVGTLVKGGRRVWFEFGGGFSRSGMRISPYTLPAGSPDFLEHRAKPGVPIPGVFNDSRPDGWGLMLLHRHFQKAGRPAASISPLE